MVGKPFPGHIILPRLPVDEPEGPFLLVGERSTDAFVNYPGYVDTGLTDGVPYYYRVTAVDREGRESDPTPVLSAVPEAQLFRAAVSVQKSMVISLAEQRLYCLENGRVVYVLLVSSGTAANPTPTGNFRILYHDYVHPIHKYPGTVCYYWMGFYQDYAIHAWPVYNGVQGNYSRLGTPASHGCVRLDPTLAHIPYYWAPTGPPCLSSRAASSLPRRPSGAATPRPVSAKPPRSGTSPRGSPGRGSTSTSWSSTPGRKPPGWGSTSCSRTGGWSAGSTWPPPVAGSRWGWIPSPGWRAPRSRRG
ncbi:MAG: L,D-transpeptidase family protein [Actinomycetota bacterium]